MMLYRLFFLPWVLTIVLACNNDRSSRSSNGSGTGSAHFQVQGCDDPQKITAIYRDFVYDLSGYSGAGGGDPFRLFDENAFVDPRLESKYSDNYIPHSNPQPTKNPSIYFPLNKGSRIVADLRISYRFSEFWLYDRSHNRDSLWIYTGDMAHWKLQAAIQSIADPASAGWRKFIVNDSARYVMIRFSSFETNITEMVMYGCPLSPVPKEPPQRYEGPRLPKKSMKEFLGVNYVMEDQPQFIRPFHHSRLYNFALDFDNDTVHSFQQVRYNMLHYGAWDKSLGKYHFTIEDLQKVNGGDVWFSIMGPPLWMYKKGFTLADRPVTALSMDPESPLSYGRHGSLLWQMAAFFGHTRVDTSLMSLSHWPARSGLGLMRTFENGNETDAWWAGSKYCTPVAYFAMSSADYDGHEKTLGNRCGLKNADSSSRLMMSGLVELDTNRLKTYNFLCNSLRTDHAFIWDGGVQYHHYCTNGKTGITPEEDSLRWRLTLVRDFTYRTSPGVDCILGENGYDKARQSRQATPLLPGYSASQSQGILLLRSINATAFAGFDAYILYWLNDYLPETAPETYQTSGIIRHLSAGATIVYPGWYYISTLAAWLGNYAPDRIIKEQGDVWIYKYRNQVYKDSVAYFVYCPTRDGTRIKGYPLQLGTVSSQEVLEVRFAEKSAAGEMHKRKSLDGRILVDAGEKPVLILLKERDGTGLNQ